MKYIQVFHTSSVAFSGPNPLQAELSLKSPAIRLTHLPGANEDRDSSYWASNLPDPAKKVLEEILRSGVENGFKHIARLRLLRVLAANGEADAGLKIIELSDIAGSGKFEAQYEESRGDLYVALGKEGQARAAYLRSQEIGDNSPYLQLKIDDLVVPEIPELSEEWHPVQPMRTRRSRRLSENRKPTTEKLVLARFSE